MQSKLHMYLYLSGAIILFAWVPFFAFAGQQVLDEEANTNMLFNILTWGWLAAGLLMQALSIIISKMQWQVKAMRLTRIFGLSMLLVGVLFLQHHAIIAGIAAAAGALLFLVSFMFKHKPTNP